jgi:hypothetical protein
VGGVDRGVPDGKAVVLDVSQLQALLRKSFNIGIDPDPRKPRALNRLELAKALQGAAEANALAAKGIALEHGRAQAALEAEEPLRTRLEHDLDAAYERVAAAEKARDAAIAATVERAASGARQ